ncbi:MAG: PAS domain-containing sensor histidine kinase [Pseudomonadota bacterium]
MAKQRAQKGKSRKQARRALSVTKALGLIIMIEGVALGLKAMDDHSRTVSAKQVEAHREALAVTERVTGKAQTVSQTLRMAYQAGWSPQQTARAHEDLDSVASLADALTAPAGSRLRDAGETASALLATSHQFGRSSSGDFIVVYDPEAGGTRLGFATAERWLPEAQGNRKFELINGTQNGAQTLGGGLVTACSPIETSNLSVCLETQTPIFTRAYLINLLLYGLLLLAPALGILGVFRLLEQRRAEAETFEGEATRAGRILKTVLAQAKAGFWSWDSKTEKIHLSPEAAALFGTPDTFSHTIGEFVSLVHPDHQAALRQALTTMRDRGTIAQVFATPDKSLWLDIRAQPDDEAGALNGILQDVTQKKVAMARTKQAENRLRSALEGFSGPFALWDARKRLIYWNRAFTRVFGLESTARSGMGYDTVMLSQATNVMERRASKDDRTEIIKVSDGRWYKIVERTTQSGGMISMGLDVSSDVRNEVELTKQQGRLRKLVADLERSERRTADLTKHLQHEKQRAERSANSKSAFLANMSHELRTPLNAINGFSEILVDEMYGPLGDERYKDYARDILASGKHLLDMITDILDMAKIEAGKMTVDLHPIDIVDPVDAAVRMIRRRAEDKEIALTLVANPDLPLVEADHRAIRQMILNLVSNAIKFTDEGGEIRVSVGRKDEEIRIAVRDNGIGIPADALPRLGEPFEQVSDTRDRNYDGTGLGLALTKSFAEMHGGRLTIASEPGRGTQVSFFLPIPDAQSEASSSVA